MRIRRFLNIVLFAVVVLFLWQVVEIWRRPVPALSSADATVSRDQPEEKALSAPSRPALDAGKQLAGVIADKDLFSPNRRRAATEESAPVASVPPPSHLKLVGVIVASDRQEAFFLDSSQGGKVVRVPLGASIGSYKVVRVSPLQAALTFGPDGAEVNLSLAVVDSSTAAKAPMLIPPVAQPGVAAVRRPGQARAVPGPSPAEGANPSAMQEETQAIRQNIQQLQQRLRQIRRQAARQGAVQEDIAQQEAAPAEPNAEPNNEEEEEEEE
jgi:hypothetical protein